MDMDCLVCNKCLVGDQKKFCSRSCSAKHNNKCVRRHGIRQTRSCVGCGQETTNPQFCSRSCRASQRQNEAFDKIRTGQYTLAWSGNAVLRKFLIAERGYKCEVCNLAEWMGQPIPLNVHHEDGDATNNKPENIKLLCLNCHGLTENFGRKNKSSRRSYRYTPL